MAGAIGLAAKVGNRAVSLLLGAVSVQAKRRVGPPGDAFEQEADRVADAVVGISQDVGGTHRWLHAGPEDTVQRKCAECEEEEEETIRRSPREGGAITMEATVVAEGAPQTPEAGRESVVAESTTGAEPTPAEGAAGTKAGGALVVEDDAEQASPSQMRKSEFLAALRESVCATANEAMATTGQTTRDCPWMEHWFADAADRDAAYVEKAIRKFAPESAAASTAQEYIPLVAARVRRSVDRWAKTGEIGDLPEGITPDIPELAGFGGLAGGLGGMFFKARPGGARVVSDRSAIRKQLGPGRSLPGGVRSRMESAFGLSFSRVRVHTDSSAAALSDQMNARAFTIGEHIAFSGGEYQPGSLTGDALLAHELAHVVQQGGGTARQRGDGGATLERDADTSAARAVVWTLTSMRKGLATVGERALPQLKSGLRLQRCGRHDPVPSATPEIGATKEELGKHAVSCMIQANTGPHTKDSGVWYAEGYKASFPGDWDNEYLKGYADPEYWERIGQWQWRLKKGRSASAGVKAWLKGLTIAECYATAIVAEVDSIRAAIGDAKFDELYGSEDKPVEFRLELGARGSNALTGGALRKTGTQGDVGTIGHRPATVGEWHYFYNHPKYLLKHPAGVYQGENAMLRAEAAPNGDQLWEGLGQRRVTERQMYMNMMADYNRPRDEWDMKRLDEIRRRNGGTLPSKYDPASGVFPDRLTSYEEILSAPPYEINETWRTGGYNPGSGKSLDPEKVEELRSLP